MNNSVAVPVIEYRVQTACGRNFVWASSSPESLFYELELRGYKALLAMPNEQYEAEQGIDGFEQLELNAEHEGAERQHEFSVSR